MFYKETPKQLQDGRYFSKISNDEEGSRVFKQFNKVNILSNFSEAPSVVIDVSDHQDTFDSIDVENKQAAKINSEAWFGKVLTDKTLEAAYTKPVSQDGEITVTKIRPDISIYDHSKNPINAEDLPENTVCDVIMELSGLTFSKKSFGPVWRLVQVKLPAPPKKPKYSEYLFEDQEDAEPEVDDEFA